MTISSTIKNKGIALAFILIAGALTLSPMTHAEPEPEFIPEPTAEIIDRRDYWKEHPEECPFEEINKAYFMALVADAVCPDASETCKSAVMTCVWNRTNTAGFPNTIEEVANQPYQWEGLTSDSYPSNETSKFARELLREWQGVYELPIPSNCVFLRLDTDGIWFRSEWKGEDEVFVAYSD